MPELRNLSQDVNQICTVGESCPVWCLGAMVIFPLHPVQTLRGGWREQLASSQAGNERGLQWCASSCLLWFSDPLSLFSSSSGRSFGGLMGAAGILETGPQGSLGMGEETV